MSDSHENEQKSSGNRYRFANVFSVLVSIGAFLFSVLTYMSQYISKEELYLVYSTVDEVNFKGSKNLRSNMVFFNKGTETSVILRISAYMYKMDIKEIKDDKISANACAESNFLRGIYSPDYIENPYITYYAGVIDPGKVVSRDIHFDPNDYSENSDNIDRSGLICAQVDYAYSNGQSELIRLPMAYVAYDKENSSKYEFVWKSSNGSGTIYRRRKFIMPFLEEIYF